ncbi:MAG: hypothetical protein ACLRWP_17725 [Bilophila wadsworthia]
MPAFIFVLPGGMVRSSPTEGGVRLRVACRVYLYYRERQRRSP